MTIKKLTDYELSEHVHMLGYMLRECKKFSHVPTQAKEMERLEKQFQNACDEQNRREDAMIEEYMRGSKI